MVNNQNLGCESNNDNNRPPHCSPPSVTIARDTAYIYDDETDMTFKHLITCCNLLSKHRPERISSEIVQWVLILMTLNLRQKRHNENAKPFCCDRFDFRYSSVIIIITATNIVQKACRLEAGKIIQNCDGHWQVSRLIKVLGSWHDREI